LRFFESGKKKAGGIRERTWRSMKNRLMLVKDLELRKVEQNGGMLVEDF
jgi:hypothetical protein